MHSLWETSCPMRTVHYSLACTKKVKNPQVSVPVVQSSKKELQTGTWVPTYVPASNLITNIFAFLSYDALLYK